MLYAVWTIAGLLAIILFVLIVMHRDYNPALSTLYSGLNLLRQTVEYNQATIHTELEGLRKQTAEIESELRKLGPKWEEHRELIDAVEKIGADGTHIGDYLKWIAAKVDETESNTSIIAMNTTPRSPSTDGMVWDADLPAKT